ncbi:hypothetical protein MAPG_09791 [Magnaporthiopsis poae ATCC 64411]|uniref:Uncharacterized protein n=1 Tax=Magnaporthiopsis poae (strain ATCC 64411 / 73-15) TaxID=644358 RepID=A0A0C4EAV7_MAGP6|nr:hypothetical protein MAPG_09791 [Magnaporthiopsis poae ATCC 64411]
MTSAVRVNETHPPEASRAVLAYNRTAGGRYLTGSPGADYDAFRGCCPTHSQLDVSWFVTQHTCDGLAICFTDDELIPETWKGCVRDAAQGRIDAMGIRGGGDGTGMREGSAIRVEDAIEAHREVVNYTMLTRSWTVGTGSGSGAARREGGSGLWALIIGAMVFIAAAQTLLE